MRNASNCLVTGDPTRLEAGDLTLKSLGKKRCIFARSPMFRGSRAGARVFYRVLITSRAVFFARAFRTIDEFVYRIHVYYKRVRRARNRGSSVVIHVVRESISARTRSFIKIASL